MPLRPGGANFLLHILVIEQEAVTSLTILMNQERDFKVFKIALSRKPAKITEL